MCGISRASSVYSVSQTMRPWLVPRNAALDRAGLPGSPKAEFDWGEDGGGCVVEVPWWAGLR